MRPCSVNESVWAETTIERTGLRDAEFNDFYRRHFPRAVAVAHALAGSRVAEDIAQEAFWATSRRWDELENPERWLFRVIANRSRSVLRRSYAEARALGRLGVGATESIALDEPSEDFWAVVRKLPRRQAQTIALVFPFHRQELHHRWNTTHFLQELDLWTN